MKEDIMLISKINRRFAHRLLSQIEYHKQIANKAKKYGKGKAENAVKRREEAMKFLKETDITVPSFKWLMDKFKIRYF